MVIPPYDSLGLAGWRKKGKYFTPAGTSANVASLLLLPPIHYWCSMTPLTPEEVAKYNSAGYLVPRYRLSDEKVLALRAALDRVIEANPGVRPEQLVSAHLGQSASEGVKGDSAFLDLARDEEIINIVSQVIGPDVILWGCQIFCKPGGDGMEVPWHQDGHYWPIRPLATCTVWVAIDDSLVENGCLRVIPRSHSEGELLDHLKEDREDVVLNQRIEDNAFDADAAADIELEAGQLSLHDVYLVHGSNPNRSTRRRAGIAIRYMPGSSHFDRELFTPSVDVNYTIDFSRRPLWLLRGEDRTGKNDLSIGH